MFFWPSLESIPEPFKIEGSDWFAIFNQAVPRVLDVQLCHDLGFMGLSTIMPRVLFSPNGRLLAAGRCDAVRILDTASGQTLCNLTDESSSPGEADEDGYTYALCFSPTSEMLYAAGDDGVIRQWDIASRTMITSFRGHKGPIRALALSRDAQLLVSGGEDRSLSLWNVSSRQQDKIVPVNGEVHDIVWTPDNEFTITAVEHQIQIFRRPDYQIINRLDEADGHENEIMSLSLSPDGKRLASASIDGTVKVWALDFTSDTQLKLVSTFEGHEDFVLCVNWAFDGRWVISGSKDRSIQIWEPDSGVGQAAVVGHRNSVLSVSTSPDGRLIASTGGDHCVRIWSWSPFTAPDTHGTRREVEAVSQEDVNIGLPGAGLPLGFLPSERKRFPVLMGDEERDWSAATLLIREKCMLKMIEDITNKPQWWLKLRDPEICAKWKKEAMEMDWAAFQAYGDFTPAMVDACMEELNLKANLYEKTGLVPVMDYSACVIKSDSIAADLMPNLKDAAFALEDVPEEQKDWHPGTNQKVLDLVHPSMWPLLYGRTRILVDKTINIQDCLGSCGSGKTIPEPDPSQQVFKRGWLSTGEEIPSLSLRFQWLPCDVKIDTNGQSNIDSYINNLHPVENAQLYEIINGFIQASLPAWDIIYRWPTEFRVQRLKTDRARPICSTRDVCEELGDCNPWNRPVGSDEPEREDDEFDQDGYDESARGKLDKMWFEETHPVDVPDVGDSSHSTIERNSPSSKFCLKPENVKTLGFFDNVSRIQVIVKLANIHLTPEKPSYDGGSWHVEGQLNEHICATALFYYDNENITDSRLEFRARSNSEELSSLLDHEQWDYRSISRIFAINAEPGQDGILQSLGSTPTLEGRALFFPNLFQHRVQPFSLTDRSKPGHRKILALFLVDPAIPIISTSNVPPQQPHWSLDSAGDGNAITERDAKRIRDELMAERSVLQQKTTESLESLDFNFCEH